MTPPFSIGSQVIIIGPSSNGHSWHTGKKFTITEVSPMTDEHSTGGMPWYPASSLWLVEEELKTGDWAEVIGPSLFCNRQHEAEIFKIEEINRDGEISCRKWGVLYPPESLRKLTPEEIQQHLGKSKPSDRIPFGLRIDSLEEYARDNDELLSAIEHKQECQAIDIKGLQLRLSAIEHKQECQAIDIKGLQLRLSAIENQLGLFSQSANGRLDILEGERPEVVDSNPGGCPWNGIMVTIQHGKSIQKCPFRYADDAQAWAYKVLDSMREARRI